MFFLTVSKSILRRAALIVFACLLVFSAGYEMVKQPLYPVSASLPSDRQDVVRDVFTERKAVSLTFEITWGERVPKQILDILKREEVRAAFFVNGAWARSHPDFIMELHEGGHDLGSMGMRPIDWRDANPVVLAEQISQSISVLEEITGSKPIWLRPPSGQLSQTGLDLSAFPGSRIVLWDIDAQDWARPGMDYIIRRVQSQLHPGAIIRLQASDSAEQTAQALTGLIATIRQEGYQMITLSQLVASEALPPRQEQPESPERE